MKRSLRYYVDGLGFQVAKRWTVDGGIRFRARRLAASEPEVGNAMWFTTLTDPDGYRIHFESATEVAEDTKLSALRARSPSSPGKAGRRHSPRRARRARAV